MKLVTILSIILLIGVRMNTINNSIATTTLAGGSISKSGVSPVATMSGVSPVATSASVVTPLAGDSISKSGVNPVATLSGVNPVATKGT
jgi:hypothetical protein